MSYDLFISYSCRDNAEGRITELKQRIEADYLGFAKEELRCFFDIEDIRGMDDWQHRILQGLRESQLLLLVLSPAYLDSPYCEWEIVEYLKYEYSRAAAGQGVAPVYFVEVPGLDTPGFEQKAAAWLARVRRRNHFDLRPWRDEGEAALKRLDVRARLDDLEKSLHTRIAKLRRIAEAPGNLPAHNPHFVGREGEMQRLHESAGLGRFGVLTAIQGMGGLGKTALAIQYACAYADFYPGGRWLVGCAGESSLAGVIRKLEADLGLTFNEEEKRDDTRAAKRVLAELEARARQGAEARAGEKDPPQPRALLLLDNVDDPGLLQPPHSDLSSGKRWLHVVVTTRMGGEDFGHDPERQMLLAVDELPIEDAVRLIESHQPDGRFPSQAERAAAEGIAELLGGFTLAIEVVAIHLRERRGRITCAAFLERLRREGLEGFEGIAKATKGGVGHQEKLVSATLGPTLDLLTPEESLTLSYAALLPPDTIPIPWLRALVSKEYPDLGKDAEIGYGDPWLDLVNHLIGLRLLQVVDIAPDSHAPRLVRMHRLVGELVRNRNESEQETWRDKLAQQVRGRCNELERIWHLHQWEIPALIAFARGLLDAQSPVAPKFMRSLCQWLPAYDCGRHSVALLQNTLAFLEAHPSEESLDLSVTHSNLGWALAGAGKYREAEDAYRRALEIDERQIPPDDYAIAVRCNNLGSLLSSQGKFVEAETFLRRAVEMCDRVLGAKHPFTHTTVNNLAGLLSNKGDYEGAQPLYVRALEASERVLGAEHPQTLMSVNNLALLILNMGRFEEAEPLLHRSMEGRRKALGPIHPNTANGVAGYAMGLSGLRRDTEAELFAHEALEIWQRSGNPEDSRVGKAHWVLGTVCEPRILYTLDREDGLHFLSGISCNWKAHYAAGKLASATQGGERSEPTEVELANLPTACPIPWSDA